MSVRGIGCHIASADGVDEFNRRTGIRDSEALSGQHIFIGSRMQVAEAFGKLDCFAVYRNRAEGVFVALAIVGGKVIPIYRKEPVDAGAFEFQRSRHPPFISQVYHRPLHGAKQPEQQIEKVNTDVHRHAAGFFFRTFPRNVVPASAARDIREHHLCSVFTPGQLLADGNQRRVQTQLKHRVNAAAGFRLQFGQWIEIPGIDDQRFLADRVGFLPKRHTNVRVVEVVGRADTHVMNTLVFALEAALLQKSLKTFRLGEKARIRKVAVQEANRVVWVYGGKEGITGVTDRFEMFGSDKPGDSSHGEIFHAVLCGRRLSHLVFLQYTANLSACPLTFPSEKQQSMLFRFSTRLVLVGLSLAFALLHAGPLYGTGAALLITILTQLYLPGWLLARAFGKHHAPHPVSRLAWILAAGLSLVICLGGLMRLLQLPVSSYVLVLHAAMGVLAAINPTPAVEAENRAWRFERRNVPLYLLVAVCCGTVLVAGYARSQIRFNNFADQSIFVSHADWLAHHPEPPAIHTRLAGTIAANGGDVRHLTDGWTYNHAAWVWTSGVPAAQLIWYDLTPLFVWTIPLVMFALAYQLTGRETAAAWCAAALTLAGLLTLDALVYRQNSLAFGQFGLLQLNTLRMFSRALMLPLALFAGLSYLGTLRLRDLSLVFLAGMALAILHPQQSVIFLVSIGATTGLWWLAQPTRIRFGRALALAGALAITLLLPYFQRANTFTATRYTESVTQSIETEDEDPRYAPPAYLLTLDVPLIGTTYIMPPSLIFYHPVVVGATVLGFIAGVGWRRSEAAQYVFGSTAITLLLLFVPGVTASFARVVTLPALPGLIFGVPMALIWGLTVDAGMCRAWKWLDARRVNPTRTSFGRLAGRPDNAPLLVRVQGSTAIVLIAVIALLLLEPISIPASARDQIRASNELQSLRTMHSTDQQLLDSLLAHLPADQTSVLITPNPVANYIVESVPGTIVTGGRWGHGNKWAFDGTLRFFGDRAPLYDGIRAPWLDTLDLDLMTEFGVTHLVVEADDTRLPQLRLQPERFELLDTPAGYWVFRVLLPIQPDRTGALYQEMNATYDGEGEQRWDGGVFLLNRPANPLPWQRFATGWATRLEQNPDDDSARYGLAITYTLMGRDEEGLVLWEHLREAYPQVPAFVEATAYTLQILGRDAEAVRVLMAALDQPESMVQALAAKTLLTPAFFIRLGPEQIERVIAVTQEAAATWEQLVVRPSLNQQRQRAILLMSAGMLETAADWLDQVPAAEISPQDLTAQASIALARGDVERALAVLRPAVDPDTMAAARFLHPDRWANNTAARMYGVLTGEMAVEAEPGCPLNDRAFVSPRAMADQGALYVMDVHTDQNEQANALTVCATYGNPTPSFGYNVRTWRIQVVSPDAETQYGAIEVPADFTDGALTRAAITLTLPEDVPPLTPAQVYIEAMYDPSLVLGRVVRDVVLNRPDDDTLPPDAVSADLRFGDDITLRSYIAGHDDDSLQVTLYWEASAPPAEDYQVFVHVVDEVSGQPLAQGDSGPVDGRYPTSQWRTDTVIEDQHIIPLDDSLPTGEYRVLIGLYRLNDGTRLPITPADEWVANGGVLVYRFTR